MTSFLQSAEWGRLQERLGRETWRLKGDDWSALVIKYPLPFGRHYLYAPRGPIFLNTNAATASIRDFFNTALKIRSAKTIFLRIEPPIPNEKAWDEALASRGFIKTQSAQPESTQIINLDQSEEDILRQMEYETRYAIRAAQKRGVKVAINETLNSKLDFFGKFWKIFKDTNARHGLRAYPPQYYWQVLNIKDGCETALFSAKLKGEVISSAIIVFFGNTAIYLYSASAHGYGRYNAPSLLLWEAIRAAKRRGAKTFDLWGVSQENPHWAGITAFKKSFGGRQIDYVGTRDYVFDKKWHFIYKAVKRVIG